jgi:putative Mg2+ transporter-C (MgtC) family protein
MELELISVFKLVLASTLGGVVGLERTVRRKPAGLRTNMFICIGATLFTILSAELARSFGGEATRIAAQLIPGIGFIGAGAIIRQGESVIGLTTAATLFVLAAIGMAIGGGFYYLAIFTTVLVMVVLTVLEWLEKRIHVDAK